MVDFGSGQGRSDFYTDDAVGIAKRCVARLRRGFQNGENAGLGRKMLFMDGHYLGNDICARADGDQLVIVVFEFNTGNGDLVAGA